MSQIRDEDSALDFSWKYKSCCRICL